jgi:hypothetical protein
MGDKPKRPDDQKQIPDGAPAQWEARPVKKQPDDLQHQLSGGDQTEYTADESQQATYLADSQQSLQSRIAGGGRDVGEEAGAEVSRLCLGCGKVTTFVQGQCTNCGYKMAGAGGTTPPDMAAPAYGATPAGTIVRNIIVVVVIVAVLALIAYFVVNALGRGGEEESTAVAPTTARSGSAPPEELPFSAITINESFHAELVDVLEEGNGAWTSAGIEAYVYRYGIYEDLDPTNSQVVRVSAYVGGEDAELAVTAPNDQTFRDATAGFFDQFNQREGVDTSVFLLHTGGEEPPSAKDVYIRYGYYYGKEHWEEIGNIVSKLDSQRDENGQYPLNISESIVRPKIRTYGGMKFMSNGYGYIPIFRTDSSGNIIMGSGKGLAAFKPEECIGYYLLCFAEMECDGLDMYGLDGINYYRDKVSPFPYQPKGKITNVPLNPDGKPDGIAAVVKDGELMDF